MKENFNDNHPCPCPNLEERIDSWDVCNKWIAEPACVGEKFGREDITEGYILSAIKEKGVLRVIGVEGNLTR